jgi:hypothetical protein
MSAEERLAVHDVLHRYALAIDTKDWQLLETVFAPHLRADFRSFGTKQIYEGPATGWIDFIRATIQGMDATQHMMGNHLYSDTYTVGGYYAVEMVREPAAWRIATYTLHVAWHDGDRHVLRAATRKGVQSKVSLPNIGNT